MQKLRILLYFSLCLFVLHSCKDKGGRITGPEDPDTPPVQPVEITSSFESEDTSFLPGEVQRIFIEGIKLTEEEYPAAIKNGIEVTLYRDLENTEQAVLFFIVPEENSEDHILQFSIEGQEQSLNFIIEEYQVIEEPVNFVEKVADQTTSELNTLIAQASETAVANLLKQKRDELAEHFETFKTMGSEEQAQIARIIHTNLIYSDQASKLKSSLTQTTLTCSDAKQLLEAQIKSVVSTSLALAVGSVMIGTPLAPLGIIASGFSIAQLLVQLQPLLNTVFDTAEVCLFPDEYILNAESSAKMNAKAKASFEFLHNEARAFLIQGQYDMDAEVTSLMNELRSALDAFYSVLPDDWVAIISKEDYRETRTEYPALYSIGSMSWGGLTESRILGSTAIRDSSLLLTFSFKKDQMPLHPVSFTFELYNKNNSQQVMSIDAVLKPDLEPPLAYNLNIKHRGQTITDTLEADFAQTFAIEDNPSRGIVELNEWTGVFTYEGFFESVTGIDSFTFTATNSAGTSNVATVTIDVLPKPCEGWNQFEKISGEWILRYYKSEARQTVIQEDRQIFYADGTWDEIESISYANQTGWTKSGDADKGTWSYSCEANVLSWEHDYWTNILYRFKVDTNNTSRMLGYCVGLCNDGYDMELIRQ
ncbi:MAG TPA: hypothetical protein VF181_10310 [Balneolaceae bacterium]